MVCEEEEMRPAAPCGQMDEAQLLEDGPSDVFVLRRYEQVDVIGPVKEGFASEQAPAHTLLLESLEGLR
jgi:hypothetical protein